MNKSGFDVFAITAWLDNQFPTNSPSIPHFLLFCPQKKTVNFFAF